VFFVEKGSANNPDMQEFLSESETGNEIWFGSNNGRIWRYGKRNGEFTLLKAETKSQVIEIRKISAEKMLFTTPDDGFFILDKTTGKIITYNTPTLSQLKSNRIVSSYVDKYEKVWFHLD
jgi:sugar lactone lactonase YvrE